MYTERTITTTDIRLTFSSNIVQRILAVYVILCSRRLIAFNLTKETLYMGSSFEKRTHSHSQCE